MHFLTNCHATPFYSALHADVPMWFPDCSPAARLSAAGTASACFEQDPPRFVRALYAGLAPGFGSSDKSGGDGCVAATLGAAAPSSSSFPSHFTESLVVRPQPELPSHLVMFDSSEAGLRPLLEPAGFRCVANFFHAHFSGDADQEVPQLRMLVYRRDAPDATDTSIN